MKEEKNLTTEETIPKPLPDEQAPTELESDGDSGSNPPTPPPPNPPGPKP